MMARKTSTGNGTSGMALTSSCAPSMALVMDLLKASKISSNSSRILGAGPQSALNMDDIKHCFDNLILIDTGANLINKKYSRDLESVLRRAKDAGVQKIMVPGSSVRSSKEALRLSQIYPDIIYSTAGIHPYDTKSIIEDPDSWYELKHIAGSEECVAIGPCGLDYLRDYSHPEIQREIFEKQLMLACSLKKPILIHERGAQKDVLKILDKFENKPPVIIRSFMGTTDGVMKYLDRRFYISLNGYLCKDKSDTGVRSLLDKGILSLDRLLVETDSPFMYPNTRASKLPSNVKTAITERSQIYLQRYCTFQRNEPCSLPALVEMIAAFMKKTPDEVALATTFNALKLFGLS